MIISDSNVNFIGSVSFEGNHANISGGKGKFEDVLYKSTLYVSFMHCSA